MAQFTFKNGKLMPTEQAAKEAHTGSPHRAEQIARLTAEPTPASATKKKGASK